MKQINFKFIFTISIYIFFSTIGALLIFSTFKFFLPSSFLDSMGNFSDDGILFVNTIGNFIIYIILFIILGLSFKRELILDFKKIKNNPDFSFKEILVAFLYLIIFSALGNFITSFMTTNESQNQTAIVEMILSKYYFFSFASTLILVILVEEIVFRKSLISLLKNCSIKNELLLILIPAFFFGLAHIVFNNDYVHFFSYFLPGLVLSYYYIKKNQNIWFSMTLHFINNLVSVILSIILFLSPL